MGELDAPAVDFALKERAMDEAPVGITLSDPCRPDNPLIYVNEAFERITGYPREAVLGRNCRFLQGPETSEEPVADLRSAIDAGEPVTVELRNYRRNGERFWNEVTVAPIRDEDDRICNFVGFQADVTRRKEAETALVAERERIDAAFDRTDRLLEAVTTAIVTSTSRPELERAVCEGLVDAGPYAAAWIGYRDTMGETIVPSATAGDPVALPQSDVSMDADHPAAVTAREGFLHGLETGDGESATEQSDEGMAGIRGDTETDETPTTISVPLRHRDDRYGVLTIVVPPSVGIDERESTVFTALGRTIASALSVLETRRILVADEVVEVELSVCDRDLFFVRITDRIDCRLEYEGAVVDVETPSLFFTAYGTPAAAVLDAAESCTDVVAASTVTENDDAALLEFELRSDALVGRLAASGAQTRSIVAEDGAATVTFTLPGGSDLRTLVERVREEYPTTELVSTTNLKRPPETRQEYFARVEAALTDRQLAALQTAYVGGYFDRPRRATGDELADAMNLTRSTFHQHLRVAQRKLLSEFFER